MYLLYGLGIWESGTPRQICVRAEKLYLNFLSDAKAWSHLSWVGMNLVLVHFTYRDSSPPEQRECIPIGHNKNLFTESRDLLSIGGLCETEAPEHLMGKNCSFRFIWAIIQNVQEPGRDHIMISSDFHSTTNMSWSQFNKSISFQLRFPIFTNSACISLFDSKEWIMKCSVEGYRAQNPILKQSFLEDENNSLPLWKILWLPGPHIEFN